MKKTALFLSTFLSIQMSHATIIWSDDFDAYTTPTNIQGLSTEVGTATFDIAGSPDADSGAVRFSGPASGRNQFAVLSSAAIGIGNFSFDLSYETEGVTPGQDKIFFQMVDGTTRNTNGSPLPSFTYTIDASAVGASTNGPAVALNFFFNTTGSASNYNDPSGGTSTLAAGSFDVWKDTSVHQLGQTSTGLSVPAAGVDSIFLQTFTQQEGFEYTIDNVAISAIPEPSAFALLGCGALGLLFYRRKR